MRAHRRKRGDILVSLWATQGRFLYGFAAPMTNRLGCTDRLGTIFMVLRVACKAMAIPMKIETS